jgi:hypothetical protein
LQLLSTAEGRVEPPGARAAKVHKQRRLHVAILKVHHQAHNDHTYDALYSCTALHM